MRSKDVIKKVLGDFFPKKQNDEYDDTFGLFELEEEDKELLATAIYDALLANAIYDSLSERNDGESKN